MASLSGAIRVTPRTRATPIGRSRNVTVHANAGGQGGPKKPILTGKKPEVKMMEYKINARLPRAEKTRMPMNIVFISTEVAPWSKTGGLGDVVGALPIELARRGHNVMTISPRYDQYYDAWDTSRSIEICGQRVGFFHTFDMGVNRIWVDHPLFLAKVNGVTGSQLYGTKAGADYKDNQLRFRIFCQAAIEATRCLPMSPGEDVMFVANDWHSALVPVMLKHIYQPSGQFKRAKSAICIHNIAFQGRFWADSFKELQLPESARGPFQFTDGWKVVFDETTPPVDGEIARAQDTYQKFAKINWLQAGLKTADCRITVSPNYATEVMSKERGIELDSVVRELGGIQGIVNGMDPTEWSPENDKFIPVNYGSTTVLSGKKAARAKLQQMAGLPTGTSGPIFGFIGRLEAQKGADILMAAVPGIVAAGGQVVILGTGKKNLERQVEELERRCPGAVGIVKFSQPLAHLITAGADFMLVPSRFEPCGLIQLHAMQYGTVPIVASTGGLVDTVKEGVTGFHMGSLDPNEMLQEDVQAVTATCARAVQAYRSGEWARMVSACINQDLTWREPAKKWEAVLEEVYFGFHNAAKKEEVKTPVMKI